MDGRCPESRTEFLTATSRSYRRVERVVSNTGKFLLLIEMEPHSGSWNMAVDETLLEAARHEGLAALRFYRWKNPTLSFGYFQKTIPDDLPESLLSLDHVRRLSGGGAILHHLEWTYSCVLPPDNLLKSDPVRLYEVVHREIIGVLNQQNIPAALRGESLAEGENEPFLCFGRRDPRDIVLGKDKILGSAQRRRRGAILQHGSLLWKRSPFAEIYPGICDLADVSESFLDEKIPEMAQRIASQLKMICGHHSIPSEARNQLPEHLQTSANRLQCEKYGAFC